MALRSLVKAEAKAFDRTSVVNLYRAVLKELPRVMTIYDVDMPLKTARTAITYHFRKQSHLEDGRVIGLLLAKGYMELEETLKQWKQKTHLLRVLEPLELQLAEKPMTLREKVILGIDR